MRSGVLGGALVAVGRVSAALLSTRAMWIPGHEDGVAGVRNSLLIDQCDAMHWTSHSRDGYSSRS